MIETNNESTTKEATDQRVGAKPVKPVQDRNAENQPSDSTPHAAADSEGNPPNTEVRMSEKSAPSPLVDDVVRPGEIQKLVVPREDICADIAASEELDLVDQQAKKIRKPGRREWIVLKRESELPTRLLIHKPNPGGMDVKYYYVHPDLRHAIRDELKDVRVFVYYAVKSRTHGLWVANVTLENSWYESLQPLFALPPAFFENHEIRVIPDKPASCYRVRHREITGDVAWPQQPTDELLGEALGPDRFILDADHPLYRDLIEGDEL